MLIVFLKNKLNIIMTSGNSQNKKSERYYIIELKFRQTIFHYHIFFNQSFVILAIVDANKTLTVAILIL